MTLRDLKLGESAKILSVGGEGALRQHFLDMGVIPGAVVTVVKFAPMGDPVELLIHGYELTLRLADAEKIEVEKVSAEPEKESKPDTAKEKKEKNESGTKTESGKDGALKTEAGKTDDHHPGYGEGGKYHPKGSGNPLPEGTKLTFALVGNQNCGKTTLFNQLTGSNQHVGNFPGVTVDRKDGPIKGYPNTLVTDLPGIYSMSPYTNEEIVSRSFVIESKPSAIINIIDATNIERNLYLTMQLLEMDVPMVVALNMMDELYANKGTVNVNKMERLLGVPVVPISAAKNAGIRELIEHAVHIAKYQEKPDRQDFCDEKDYGGAVHRCIHGVSLLIEDHAVNNNLPVRFAATKAIEGDELVLKQLSLDPNEEEMLDHIVKQMEVERGLDKSAAIADMRFAYIKKVCDKTVKKPQMSKERARSEKIDRFLTGKYTAIPAFLVIMALTHVDAVFRRIRGNHEDRIRVTAHPKAFPLADGIKLRALVPPDNAAEGILLVAGLFDVLFPAAVGFGFEGNVIGDGRGQAL